MELLCLEALLRQCARMSPPEVCSPPEEESPGQARPAARQRQVRLTIEQIDQLVEAYQAGASWPELSLQFGIGRTTVWGHLRRRGVPKRKFHKLHREEFQRLEERYAAGVSMRSLAVEFGVSREAVRSALVDSGVSVRPRGRPSTPEA